MFRGYRGYTHCCWGSMNYSQNHSENPTTLSRPSVLYIVLLLLLVFGCTTPTASQGIHLDLCHWIFPGVLRGPDAVLAIEPNLATSKHPTSCTYYLFRLKRYLFRLKSLSEIQSTKGAFNHIFSFIS